MRISILLLTLCAFGLTSNVASGGSRKILSLDGTWEIADGVSPTEPPEVYTRRVPVPGLANLARPAFEDIDQFDSKELISNRIRSGKLPESARVAGAGVPRQARNYLWYRRTFRAPAKGTVARLTIGKAQFGTAVWLNGVALGDYAGCFSASHWMLSDQVRWGAENEVVVRIGAHPGVLPDTFPAGTDFEKLKWTPGIYDRVTVAFCDEPWVETVQVAPRVDPREVVVETRVRNTSASSVRTRVTQRVRPWNAGGTLGESAPVELVLGPGEARTIRQTVAVPAAPLWTPETPRLCVVETSTGGDTVRTRFGMREFRSDAATGRFYLNGRPYYLRGSNITFHRFLEDPACGDLPWDERWVRRLLGDIPKRMHWNAFRFCIGPVPDHWLEIADEAGLLIQNEFFVWTGAPSWDKGYTRSYDEAEMIRQFGDWMRDNWNHASVAIWDANNETLEPLFGDKIIPAVRGLDLSHRPWENSYNPPAAPDDPVEHHPYLCYGGYQGELRFRMSDLETYDPTPKAAHLPKTPHPMLINEYGWLWLNRDGSPTLLTEGVYRALLGTNATAAERFALNASMLAGKTEFWRSSRRYAGVLHFVYLTCSYPGVFTSDHWLDLRRLRLEPNFAEQVAEAFKPLGVYVNFFQPTLPAASDRSFAVRLVNDHDRVVSGTVVLAFTDARGRMVTRTERPFRVDAMGEVALEIPLRAPVVPGAYELRAVARGEGLPEKPTVGRRRLVIQ